MKFIDRVDAVARRFERFVSGDSVSDPLYLTNRTFGQKFRTVVLIGTPILAIVFLVYLAFEKQFDRPLALKRDEAAATAKPKEPTGEITAKVLPDIDKSYSSEQSKDVEVLEVFVSRAAEPVLSGRLRNNSDKAVRVADIVFDVTNSEGSQVGGVSVRVENIPARQIASFRMMLPQRDARGAIVRDLHSR
jgi:hypothetical protein